MDVTERLQRLQQLGLHRGSGQLRTPAPLSSYRSIAAAVQGEWLTTPYGNCFVSTTTQPLDSRRGRLPLSACLDLAPEAVAACAGDPLLTSLDLQTAAFIDTETSGLAGGTGTFAFLIGVGTFGEEGFTVQQYFMTSPADERALLDAVCGTLDHCTSVVSYNGRAFDLPLLNTRLLLHRQFPRLQDAPHLDLLFPARRLWRARLGSCTLGNVERTALDIHRSKVDVPGWLVPALYRQYLRTGEADELRSVFYHNAEDILSLVTLSAVLGNLFASPDDPRSLLDALPAVDRVSLGGIYEVLGWVEASEHAYRHALVDSIPGDQRDRALRQLSSLLKKLNRRDEAADWWRAWTQEEESRAHLVPHTELAKYHEWHTLDLDAALAWTELALQLAETWPPSPERTTALADLHHRRMRLKRKRGQGGPGSPADSSQ